MKLIAFLQSNYIETISTSTKFDYSSCIDAQSYLTDIQCNLDADDQPINKSTKGKITVEFMVGPDASLYKPFYDSLTNQASYSFSLLFNLKDPDETEILSGSTKVADCSCSNSIVFDGYITSIKEEYKQNPHIESTSIDLYMTVEILATNIVYIGAKTTTTEKVNDEQVTKETYQTVVYQFSN